MSEPVGRADGGHARGERSAGSRERRGVALVVALAVLAWLLWERFQAVRHQQDVAHAFQAEFRRELGTSRPDWNVFVVRITDADYDSLFHARSPLDTARLRELILAIDRAGPAVIGVDLDTSDSSFRSLDIATRAQLVWAAGTATLCRCERPSTGCGVRLPVVQRMTHRYCRDEEAGALVPFEVRGGVGTPAGRVGVATLVNDRDGSIRRYRRSVPGAGGTPLPTFASRVIAQAGREPRRYRDAEELYIRFDLLDPAAQYSAAEVLDAARDSATVLPFRGRIVLLGGEYWAARDLYATPLGWLPGVDVHAQIIESELRGDGVPPAAGAWVMGLLVVGGVLILLVFHFWPFHAAFWRAVALILVFAPLGSWLATRSSLALLFYFVPVLVVVLIHQMFEYAQDVHSEQFRDRIHDAVRPLVPASTAPLDALDATARAKQLGPDLEAWARGAVWRRFLDIMLPRGAGGGGLRWKRPAASASAKPGAPPDGGDRDS